MAVSKITLIVLVASVAVSLATAKSFESDSMDYAHQLLMDMMPGVDKRQAMGPASQSFGRALFGQNDVKDDQVVPGIELFKADQVFETVAMREPRAKLDMPQQDAIFGELIGNDAHYLEEILLERESEDLAV